MPVFKIICILFLCFRSYLLWKLRLEWLRKYGTKFMNNSRKFLLWHLINYFTDSELLPGCYICGYECYFIVLDMDFPNLSWVLPTAWLFLQPHPCTHIHTRAQMSTVMSWGLGCGLRPQDLAPITGWHTDKWASALSLISATMFLTT